MLLCVAGCALGTLIGCGIALIQQHFGIVKIPGDTLLENYPVSLNIGDVATIVIIVIITGSVVSWATVRARLRSDI
jgi:lipoprotein-releasing system permease protein